VLAHRFQRLRVVGRGVAGLGPRHDGALAQRQRLVRHHKVGLEAQLGAKAIALGARAKRVVERKQPWLDLVDGEA
jgi:hypothetical protein